MIYFDGRLPKDGPTINPSLPTYVWQEIIYLSRCQLSRVECISGMWPMSSLTWSSIDQRALWYIDITFRVTGSERYWLKIAYRTVKAFEADFGEFGDTSYLAKVCLENERSCQISPEWTLIPHPYFDITVVKNSRFIMSHLKRYIMSHLRRYIK